MIWFVVMHLFATLLDLIRIGRLSEHEKDLEILLLRQQLGIAERKLHKPVRASRVERLTLAVVTAKLKSSSNRSIGQLRHVIRIFQPETVLGWHRQLVRRKWTYNPDDRGGRPRIDRELERLVVRLAQENHDWGYDRIAGELAKLGYTISDETIGNILRRHNIPPAPDRGRSPSWRHPNDSLQGPDSGLRFLHRRNAVSKDDLCVLLHRIGKQTCSFRRLYHESA
jgi:putative transposase